MLILRPRPGKMLKGYVIRSIELPYTHLNHPSLIDGQRWVLGFFTRAEANAHIRQKQLSEEYVEVVATRLDTISIPHRFLLADGKTKVKIMPARLEAIR